jgi:hypothetical protein
MTDTLGQALPREMARVRDEVMPAYLEIGPDGALALHLIRQALDRAATALAEGDVLAMLAVYKDLQGFEA